MKPTLVAILATCAAMLVTSGIVVFATAATTPPTASAADEVTAELQAQIDSSISRQLNVVKSRLHHHS